MQAHLDRLVGEAAAIRAGWRDDPGATRPVVVRARVDGLVRVGNSMRMLVDDAGGGSSVVAALGCCGRC